MTKINKEMLNEVVYLKDHIKEVESVKDYCEDSIKFLDNINNGYDRNSYEYCYNEKVIGLVNGVLNIWYEYESITCCVSYLEDVEEWIKSGELVYEY